MAARKSLSNARDIMVILDGGDDMSTPVPI